MSVALVALAGCASEPTPEPETAPAERAPAATHARPLPPRPEGARTGDPSAWIRGGAERLRATLDEEIEVLDVATLRRGGGVRAWLAGDASGGLKPPGDPGASPAPPARGASGRMRFDANGDFVTITRLEWDDAALAEAWVWQELASVTSPFAVIVHRGGVTVVETSTATSMSVLGPLDVETADQVAVRDLRGGTALLLAAHRGDSALYRWLQSATEGASAGDIVALSAGPGAEGAEVLRTTARTLVVGGATELAAVEPAPSAEVEPAAEPTDVAWIRAAAARLHASVDEVADDARMDLMDGDGVCSWVASAAGQSPAGLVHPASDEEEVRARLSAPARAARARLRDATGQEVTLTRVTWDDPAHAPAWVWQAMPDQAPMAVLVQGGTVTLLEGALALEPSALESLGVADADQVVLYDRGPGWVAMLFTARPGSTRLRRFLDDTLAQVQAFPGADLRGPRAGRVLDGRVQHDVDLDGPARAVAWSTNDDGRVAKLKRLAALVR